MRVHDCWHNTSFTDVLKQSGLIGCGGAGFPTWPKYLGSPKVLLTNAQESEPGYYIDKWLHKTHVAQYAELYRYLLKEQGFEKMIISPKTKDREWFTDLEKELSAEVCDCTARNRFDISTIENPFIFMYTDDRYAFGKESALLLITGQQKIGPDKKPSDFGWVVNNSQTLINMHTALTTGAPVTDKYVHVYGECKHTFQQAPIGTRADDLFAAAGTSIADIKSKGYVVLEGGPGWYEIVEDVAAYSLSRRTNSILVIDPSFRDPTKKDVMAKPNKPGYPKEGEVHEMKPSHSVSPKSVCLRLQDNPGFAVVTKAVPFVNIGDSVVKGQVVAKAGENFSVPAHASIDGKVTAISENCIEICA